MTERELQAAVIEAFRVSGWLTAHFRPCRTAHGWRTAVEGDGAGFPDLLAVRGDRLVAVEFKVARRPLTAEQERWLRVLAGAGIETYCWREQDWLDGSIDGVLRRQTRARLR